MKKSFKTLQELQKRRDDIYKIASQYGVSNIRVFGSVVRGEDKKNSDVDFLVRQKKGVSLFEIVRFKREVEKLLHKKTDVILDDSLNKQLKKIILNEAVVI